MSETLDIEPLASPPLSEPWVPLWPVSPYAPKAIPGARVYSAPAQLIPNAVQTPLTFDTERFDTDNIHDATNPSRLTCRTAGKYVITGHVAWGVSGGGSQRGVQIGLNRSVLLADQRTPVGPTALDYPASVATIWDLAVGDYVELNVYQDSGAPLNAIGTTAGPEFAMVMVPPTVVSAGAQAISYGTTLPVAPIDGQEAILVDSVTNPSYQWRFRYNAGSTSAYKWEFVGGTPLTSQASANEATASTTYVDLATVQSLIVPRAGRYRFHFTAISYNPSVTYNWVALSMNNVAQIDAGVMVTEANGQVDHALLWQLDCPVSADMRLKFRVTGGTGNFLSRSLEITPIRVS